MRRALDVTQYPSIDSSRIFAYYWFTAAISITVISNEQERVPVLRRTIGVWLALAFVLLAGCACADALTISCQIGSDSRAMVRAAEIDGDRYLFLPSCADTEPLVIDADEDYTLALETPLGETLPIAAGEPFSLYALPAGELNGGEFSLIVQCKNGETERVTVMLSANIRSLFVRSADPDSEGRIWLEDCFYHEKRTTGEAVLLRADGSVAYGGKLAEIRGRGNTTWLVNPSGGADNRGDFKKPYQIKLDDKTDLLDTGDPREANKRWVLLADYFDGTLLRNRVAFDLARELGLWETSHCQPVDLYYDGEYRGLYLLAEKVEVGSGRVDVLDYDELLEDWNEADEAGLETHPQILSVNQYGDAFSATADIWDAGLTDLGGYLIELDNSFSELERAYFTLQNGSLLTIHNPKYASEGMVRYISELFEELCATVTNEGVHPQSGEEWKDYFDVDSLLPFFWVGEWTKNLETWNNSSTYFVLPERSRQIRMGPVWDFDLALNQYWQDDGSIADSTGLIETANRRSIGYGLLQIPAFRQLAAQYYADALEPVVTQILLGDIDAHGTVLHSLTWYWEEEAASRRMNDVLWNPVQAIGRIAAPTYEENYANLRSFMEERTAWLVQETARWLKPEELDTVGLALTANYANAEATLRAVVDGPDSDIFRIDQAYTLEREATEATFAQWRGDLTVSMEVGYVIADGAALLINGTEIPYQTNGDGSITTSVLFEDLSYRPAKYRGSDYGLVFDADYFAAQYPEIAAAAGNDREAMLRYYVENGIEAGQAANAFFNPREVLDVLPDVRHMLGDRYEDVVFFFIEAGYTDWMSRMGRTFRPEVRQAEPQLPKE